MSGNAAPYTELRVQRLRDVICAVLRDEAAPLSTRAVAARVMPAALTRLHTRTRLTVGQIDHCGLGHQIVRYDGVDPKGRHIYLVASPPDWRLIYTHLQALQAAGHCTAHRGPDGEHQTYWRYTHLDDAQRIHAELEAALTLPSPGRR